MQLKTVTVKKILDTVVKHYSKAKIYEIHGLKMHGP